MSSSTVLKQTLREVGTALRRPEELALRWKEHGPSAPSALIFPIFIANAAFGLAVYGMTMHMDKGLQAMLGIEDPHHHHEGFTDELREKLSEGAADEVRGQLLVDAVAEQEKIDISDDEIDDRITRIANLQGHKASKLRAEMDRDGRLDNLRFQLRHEKTLDFLVAKARHWRE